MTAIAQDHHHHAPVALGRPEHLPARRVGSVDWNEETGAQTAEYGIVTLAAVGFAGVLAAVLAGSDVQGLLLGIVKNALSFG
ncbi:DUF4244 domain-containing protein [Citricoccus sp. GCM10030269]|uniref:DUF4244 domain-containing protein n=1 Tax=Citricoccus sp. GCM10030269 TaxID=3273388 RepID=UPI003617F695